MENSKEPKTEPPKLTKDDIDFFIANDIGQNIRRIKAILGTDILSPDNAGHPLVKSAFTELMICLRDLMAKTEKYGTRISFTDDMVATPEVFDITELTTFIRDALCHVGIYNHFIVPNRVKASFNIVYGKGTLANVGGIEFTSEFQDDVCYFFGIHKIYLKRHILRAFAEAETQLLALAPSNPGLHDVVRY